MSADTPTTTLAVVRELLHRIGEGDPDRIAAMYAERIDWKVDWPESEHGRAATPWIRHRSTRGDAAAHFRALGEHHVPGEAATAVDRVLVDGDEAVVLGEIRQTARSTGRAYRARFALHLTVEDGRVTRHHVYEDSLAVAQAFDADRGHAPATAPGSAAS
ncbi:nuclear transport factor 2 family protein [Marinitenerispora sediminis]|uniref:Ketosteroid isomerase n=1 Tax=Marinitenerispora sediminis TaxID=1931232 RepID=A0A368T9N6_9ACTN|nr:nuclear transport factor 2 family protein [Marinitenerispora sediminis]RCV58138.1 ketosteroid isomerase [Marinitenerispora sediminis]RCV58760.1 ketosteroid isomerase [Marinitenerispora sediminis]RCV61411.1 ketosteroid isomerase [Marinitenerispora sediminis]